ncbi:hypothetical protein ATK36_4779 [Amycolatopsis sulphurea]|uniref:Uncharacterized protein n=1 Tax=Amycolatopsis sulphurea TaxID=76022 RepID=A0A2A9FGR4_9PSEU|nr:hypothetical protein [Amycolatopsis sulphurea]PFG49619.1 hypothetical protein ATK36_4779 [Amycolatopsis sulphurea]
MQTTASGHATVSADARSALGTVRVLVISYAVLSVLTLGAIVLLRNHHDLVTVSVWIRGGLVALSSWLTLFFVARAAQGHRGALRRLQRISVVLVVAIVVIIALPGAFPMWLRIEQGVCGLLLLGVAVLVNSRKVRSSFAN